MREVVCLVLAALFLIWSVWLLATGSHFLFLLPMGAAILCAEGLDDSDGGDCDPCMGA